MAAESTYPPHRLGRRGERLAARVLEARGWRILARNYKAGRREIDIVARRERLLLFVEVKARAVALDYLTRHVRDDVDVRFDVVSVWALPGGRTLRIQHIEDAWRPGWT